MKKWMTAVFPGLLLSIGVAIMARGLGLVIPQLGGATLAILLGIILGNTVCKQPIFAKGTKFSESKFLEISVVLLGLTVTFQTIGELGIKGFIYVLLQMAVTIFGVLLIGKRLHFNQKMSFMMAGGNAVCGSSAIASIAPTIGAKNEEKGQIITLVNLLGTVMMLTLPFLGLAVFGGDNPLKESALLGGTLQSVGQVVAGASLRSPEIVKYAMLFKIIRIMMLAFVVLIFERMTNQGSAVKGKRIGLPWYVVGFLIFCILNSFFSLPKLLDEGAHSVSTWLETSALAAIGLRLDLKKFLKEGPRFLVFGLSVGIVQVVAALLLISLLGI